jgi:hypothetical protein
MQQIDTARIRKILTDAFSDDEFTALCFDHYRQVYDAFSAEMTRLKKIQLLLEYCVRRGALVRLVEQIREARPELAGKLAPGSGRTDKAVVDFKKYRELSDHPYWREKAKEYLREMGVNVP